MNNLTYAPVIIPTLNRYDHLKKCLESLSLCTGAEFTDVFIGLDYPAKDSHWEGYKKIKKYLEEAKLNFKSLNVIKRNRNYGLGPSGNCAQLQQDLFQKKDSLIISEDDNIFSPNFLIYINKGLEKFKNDNSVLAICGYKPFYPTKAKENSFSMRNDWFFAWGYGIWKNKWNQLPPIKEYFKTNFSIHNIFSIKKEIGAERAICYLAAVNGFYKCWTDTPFCLYGYLEKKNFIYPSQLSLVRNMGWDKSGIHCLAPKELCENFSAQPISNQNAFDFIGTGYEYYQENKKIAKTNSYAKISEYTFWKRFCKGIIKYILLQIKTKINLKF